MRPTLVLTELTDGFSILRFESSAAVSQGLLEAEGAFVAVTRTAAELSVICPTLLADTVTSEPQLSRSDGWRCLRIETATLPDETPGIIASVVEPLADAGISTFAVATFDTDHVLVQDVEGAASALIAAGHTVVRHEDSPSELPVTSGVRIRPGRPGDSADLALLADAATRRLVAWMWDSEADPGQSAFEVGRTSIHSNVDGTYHYSRWLVFEQDGRVVGGLNSFVAPAIDLAKTDSYVIEPLNELKSLATGTWYVSTASVFPEARGHGVGQVILAEADRLAAGAGCDKVTLMVASFNPGAIRLYERFGYREWDRRTFVPFPGSGESGDWILMVKDL